MSADEQLKIIKEHWSNAAKNPFDHRNVSPVTPDSAMQEFIERQIISH